MVAAPHEHATRVRVSVPRAGSGATIDPISRRHAPAARFHHVTPAPATALIVRLAGAPLDKRTDA